MKTQLIIFSIIVSLGIGLSAGEDDERELQREEERQRTFEECLKLQELREIIELHSFELLIERNRPTVARQASQPQDDGDECQVCYGTKDLHQICECLKHICLTCLESWSNSRPSYETSVSCPNCRRPWLRTDLRGILGPRIAEAAVADAPEQTWRGVVDVWPARESVRDNTLREIERLIRATTTRPVVFDIDPPPTQHVWNRVQIWSMEWFPTTIWPSLRTVTQEMREIMELRLFELRIERNRPTLPQPENRYRRIELNRIEQHIAATRHALERAEQAGEPREILFPLINIHHEHVFNRVRLINSYQQEDLNRARILGSMTPASHFRVNL